jgi:hypothetical protein
MKSILFTSLLAGLVMAAAAPGRATYLTRIEGWESTADDRLEFPVQKGMTLMIDGRGSPSYMRASGARLDVRPSGDAPAADANSVLGGMLARGEKAGCVHAPPVQEKLENGWDALSAELKCGANGVAMIACTVEGRVYVISGNGFSLADLRAFVQSGRVIPPERRPSPAAVAQMEKEAGTFNKEVDRLSGGPSFRAGLRVIIALVIFIPLAALGLLIRYLLRRRRLSEPRV